MRHLPLAGLAIAVVLSGTQLPVAAQTVRYVDGLFIEQNRQPVELKAYAEIVGRGILRMTKGSLSDAPAVETITRVMCSLPSWQPVGAFVASEALFRDDQAERRNLAMASRKLNVYALELRIADLETREKIDSLLRAVRASQDAPGYAFIVLSNSGYQRFYPIRLTPVD